MRVVGLVSTFREGHLALSAVRSLLPACDIVHVWDGPIGAASPAGRATDWNVLRKEGRVIVHTGEWETDAEKRTAMLTPTRRLPAPVWGVILDGDEILLHGEYLMDHLLWLHADAEFKQAGEPAKLDLRLTEVNGSVSLLGSRVLRLDLVKRWLASSNQLEFVNGVVAAFPNVQLLAAGEPDASDADRPVGVYQRRRPLAGEPHVLHRSGLRDPARLAERQHKAESVEWDRLVREAGLGQVDLGQPKDERVGIWTPT